MMDADFAPIKITGCDESKVRKASGSKSRYIVPFSLSMKPSEEWEDIFDDVWRAERKKAALHKAQSYIRKGALVLESALGDVKATFPAVRSSIDATNVKYAAHLQQKAEKDEKKRRKREEEKLAEKQAIHEALTGLDLA
jgi:hypothetical protein